MGAQQQGILLMPSAILLMPSMPSAVICDGWEGGHPAYALRAFSSADPASAAIILSNQRLCLCRCCHRLQTTYLSSHCCAPLPPRLSNLLPAALPFHYSPSTITSFPTRATSTRFWSRGPRWPMRRPTRPWTRARTPWGLCCRAGGCEQHHPCSERLWRIN